ncbi:MAG: hypothetical protein AB9860_01575 [Methanomassiliicoccales archaeon]
MSLESGIWLRFDPILKRFLEIRINNVIIPINLGTNIPDDILAKLQFLNNYSKEPDVNESEVQRLIKFMLVKEVRNEPNEDQPSGHIEPQKTPFRLKDEDGNLRHIVYDNVKLKLETDHKADLDSLSEVIAQKISPQFSYESVRGAVSSTLSALRNAFPDMIQKSWNEPTWRGKSTGRNPHIEVKQDFIMPEYAMIWSMYKKYLRNRKLR